MTPADLRKICDTLDDERGPGGQTKLVRFLGWHYSALWRKLNGLSKITLSDKLAIRQAVASLHGISNVNLVLPMLQECQTAGRSARKATKPE